MDPTNSLVPADNAGLTHARSSLRQQLEAAAEQNTAQLLEEGYTALEVRAVNKVEQLRLLGGFELVTLLERGALMNEIEQEGLVTLFPGEYQRLEDICQAMGISKSEYSDTRTLCDTIFPWLEEHTETPLIAWWEDIGKSKFRELAPVLYGLIQGESARNHETVNEAIRAQLDNAMANILTEAVVAADRPLDEDEVATLTETVTADGSLQLRAILSVLEFGHLPVREMRQAVRPSRTPNIVATMIRGENVSFAVLRMSAEQIELFQRLIGGHLDLAVVGATQHLAQLEALNSIVPE